MDTGPALGLPSLLLVTEALLVTVPHVAAVVGLVMCTAADAPDARSAGPNESTPLLILQLLAGLCEAIVQVRPLLVGSVSVTVTLRAMPAPELVTMIT